MIRNFAAFNKGFDSVEMKDNDKNRWHSLSWISSCQRSFESIEQLLCSFYQICTSALEENCASTSSLPPFKVANISSTDRESIAQVVFDVLNDKIVTERLCRFGRFFKGFETFDMSSVSTSDTHTIFTSGWTKKQADLLADYLKVPLPLAKELILFEAERLLQNVHAIHSGGDTDEFMLNIKSKTEFEWGALLLSEINSGIQVMATLFALVSQLVSSPPTQDENEDILTKAHNQCRHIVKEISKQGEGGMCRSLVRWILSLKDRGLQGIAAGESALMFPSKVLSSLNKNTVSGSSNTTTASTISTSDGSLESDSPLQQTSRALCTLSLHTHMRTLQASLFRCLSLCLSPERDSSCFPLPPSPSDLLALLLPLIESGFLPDPIPSEDEILFGSNNDSFHSSVGVAAMDAFLAEGLRLASCMVLFGASAIGLDWIWMHGQLSSQKNSLVTEKNLVHPLLKNNTVAKSLHDALESLSNRILLMNNGSSDNTEAFASCNPDVLAFIMAASCIYFDWSGTGSSSTAVSFASNVIDSDSTVRAVRSLLAEARDTTPVVQASLVRIVKLLVNTFCARFNILQMNMGHSLAIAFAGAAAGDPSSATDFWIAEWSNDDGSPLAGLALLMHQLIPRLQTHVSPLLALLSSLVPTAADPESLLASRRLLSLLASPLPSLQIASFPANSVEPVSPPTDMIGQVEGAVRLLRDVSVDELVLLHIGLTYDEQPYDTNSASNIYGYSGARHPYSSGSSVVGVDATFPANSVFLVEKDSDSFTAPPMSSASPGNAPNCLLVVLWRLFKFVIARARRLGLSPADAAQQQVKAWMPLLEGLVLFFGRISASPHMRLAVETVLAVGQSCTNDMRTSFALQFAHLAWASTSCLQLRPLLPFVLTALRSLTWDVEIKRAAYLLHAASNERVHEDVHADLLSEYDSLCDYLESSLASPYNSSATRLAVSWQVPLALALSRLLLPRSHASTNLFAPSPTAPSNISASPCVALKDFIEAVVGAAESSEKSKGSQASTRRLLALIESLLISAPMPSWSLGWTRLAHWCIEGSLQPLQSGKNDQLMLSAYSRFELRLLHQQADMLSIIKSDLKCSQLVNEDSQWHQGVSSVCHVVLHTVIARFGGWPAQDLSERHALFSRALRIVRVILSSLTDLPVSLPQTVLEAKCDAKSDRFISAAAVSSFVDSVSAIQSILLSCMSDSQLPKILVEILSASVISSSPKTENLSNNGKSIPVITVTPATTVNAPPSTSNVTATEKEKEGKRAVWMVLLRCAFFRRYSSTTFRLDGISDLPASEHLSWVSLERVGNGCELGDGLAFTESIISDAAFALDALVAYASSQSRSSLVRKLGDHLFDLTASEAPLGSVSEASLHASLMQQQSGGRMPILAALSLPLQVFGSRLGSKTAPTTATSCWVAASLVASLASFIRTPLANVSTSVSRLLSRLVAFWSSHTLLSAVTCEPSSLASLPQRPSLSALLTSPITLLLAEASEPSLIRDDSVLGSADNFGSRLLLKDLLVSLLHDAPGKPFMQKWNVESSLPSRAIAATSLAASLINYEPSLLSVSVAQVEVGKKLSRKHKNGNLTGGQLAAESLRLATALISPAASSDMTNSAIILALPNISAVRACIVLLERCMLVDGTESVPRFLLTDPIAANILETGDADSVSSTRPSSIVCDLIARVGMLTAEQLSLVTSHLIPLWSTVLESDHNQPMTHDMIANHTRLTEAAIDLQCCLGALFRIASSLVTAANNAGFLDAPAANLATSTSANASHSASEASSIKRAIRVMINTLTIANSKFTQALIAFNSSPSSSSSNINSSSIAPKDNNPNTSLAFSKISPKSNISQPNHEMLPTTSSNSFIGSVQGGSVNRSPQYNSSAPESANRAVFPACLVPSRLPTDLLSGFIQILESRTSANFFWLLPPSEALVPTGARLLLPAHVVLPPDGDAPPGVSSRVSSPLAPPRSTSPPVEVSVIRTLLHRTLSDAVMSAAVHSQPFSACQQPPTLAASSAPDSRVSRVASPSWFDRRLPGHSTSASNYGGSFLLGQSSFVMCMAFICGLSEIATHGAGNFSLQSAHESVNCMTEILELKEIVARALSVSDAQHVTLLAWSELFSIYLGDKRLLESEETVILAASTSNTNNNENSPSSYKLIELVPHFVKLSSMGMNTSSHILPSSSGIVFSNLLTRILSVIVAPPPLCGIVSSKTKLGINFSMLDLLIEQATVSAADTLNMLVMNASSPPNVDDRLLSFPIRSSVYLDLSAGTAIGCVNPTEALIKTPNGCSRDARFAMSAAQTLLHLDSCCLAVGIWKNFALGQDQISKDATAEQLRNGSHLLWSVFTRVAAITTEFLHASAPLIANPATCELRMPWILRSIAQVSVSLLTSLLLTAHSLGGPQASPPEETLSLLEMSVMRSLVDVLVAPHPPLTNLLLSIVDDGEIFLPVRICAAGELGSLDGQHSLDSGACFRHSLKIHRGGNAIPHIPLAQLESMEVLPAVAETANFGREEIATANPSLRVVRSQALTGVSLPTEALVRAALAAPYSLFAIMQSLSGVDAARKAIMNDHLMRGQHQFQGDFDGSHELEVAAHVSAVAADAAYDGRGIGLVRTILACLTSAVSLACFAQTFTSPQLSTEGFLIDDLLAAPYLLPWISGLPLSRVSPASLDAYCAPLQIKSVPSSSSLSFGSPLMMNRGLDENSGTIVLSGVSAIDVFCRVSANEVLVMSPTDSHSSGGNASRLGYGRQLPSLSGGQSPLLIRRAAHLSWCETLIFIDQLMTTCSSHLPDLLASVSCVALSLFQQANERVSDTFARIGGNGQLASNEEALLVLRIISKIPCDITSLPPTLASRLLSIRIDALSAAVKLLSQSHLYVSGSTIHMAALHDAPPTSLAEKLASSHCLPLMASEVPASPVSSNSGPSFHPSIYSQRLELIALEILMLSAYVTSAIEVSPVSPNGYGPVGSINLQVAQVTQEYALGATVCCLERLAALKIAAKLSDNGDTTNPKKLAKSEKSIGLFTLTKPSLVEDSAESAIIVPVSLSVTPISECHYVTISSNVISDLPILPDVVAVDTFHNLLVATLESLALLAHQIVDKVVAASFSPTLPPGTISERAFILAQNAVEKFFSAIHHTPGNSRAGSQAAHILVGSTKNADDTAWVNDIPTLDDSTLELLRSLGADLSVKLNSEVFYEVAGSRLPL